MKACEYGMDDNLTLSLIKDYPLEIIYPSTSKKLSRVGYMLLSWQSVTRSIPQGSILGSFLFNIFMTDLRYVVCQTTLSTCADDT